MKWVLSWVANTVAILLAAYLLPQVEVSSVLWAVIAALVLGVLNTVVRPIFKVLTLPLTCLTLGLFILVVNGIMVQLLDWLMGTRFEVSSFIWAIITALLISLITTVVNVIVGQAEEE